MNMRDGIKQIYADNAATTKMSKTVVEAMLPYMEMVYGNPSSLHTMGQQAKEALEAARERIAKCIGCKAREITFTSGGSEADNQAIVSAAKIGERKGKKHIISTKIEHHAVLHTLDKLEKEGFEITLLEVDEQGMITAEQVKEAIRLDTCLVTVMYANNEIGTILPIAQIGEICKESGVLFHTDAVQAVGHLPVDVKKDGVDMLSFSAHKFHGPKGIGALYVKKGIVLSSLVEGGAQERGKRAGTENLPAIVGMAVALEEACEKMQENTEKLLRLQSRLIKGLAQIPHSLLNGSIDMEELQDTMCDVAQDASERKKLCRLPGNISFCFEGIEGEAMLLLLDDKGICASSGSACTSGSLDPSHVLLAIGRPHEIAHGSLRLSLSAENTKEEVDDMIAAVTDVVTYLRSISPVWRDLVDGKTEFVIK